MVGCKECPNASHCEESGISREEISMVLVAMDILRSPAAVREISGMEETMDEALFTEACRKLEPVLESCPYVRLTCELTCPLEETEYAAG